jgi:flavin reductase (DIM6/NTAB) family NADH-FMN oxidoreductase RutF
MQTATPQEQSLAARTRLALRRLASSVAVVTCRDGDARHAMTATAVNAMSMDPPSMIVCVNRSAAFHAVISGAAHFAINILHRDQVDISVGCGGKAKGEDRFGLGVWGEEDGVPVLTDAQAHVACANEARFEYGSHSIFVGRVVSIGMHGEIDPLIYVDGHYTCLPAGQVVASQSQKEIEMSRQLAV